MRIQTNTAANSALGYMRVNNQATERSIQKLSSGFRINRAADDAAGLAIANTLRAQGRSLAQASRNAAQANAMLQIADGATQTVASILDRMKELGTQANSANVGSTGRAKIQDEFTNLVSEIDRIVSTTAYQGTSLVNGGFGTSVTGGTWSNAGGGIYDVKTSNTQAATYTISNNAAAGNSVTMTRGSDNASQTITVTANAKQDISFSAFGITLELDAAFVRSTGTAAGTFDTRTIVVGAGGGAGFQVSSSGAYGGDDLVTVGAIDLRATQSTGLNLGAGGLTLGSVISSGTDVQRQTLLANIDNAIGHVNTQLGKLGAAQNRIDFATTNVNTLLQNVQAAESTIRDADMAAEMSSFTKNNILQQAAQSMLSQANQGTQGILQLLRG